MKKKVLDENRKLYELIEGRIKIVQQGIRTLYLGSDEITGNLIHGIGQNIYFLKDVFFDLLIDRRSAQDILDFPPAHLATDLPKDVEDSIGKGN